jgi:hypothetical protein
MEAPTLAPDDLAAVQRMPEAELLAAAMEQEAKVKTLVMTLEELIKYSMTEPTAPSAEPSIPANFRSQWETGLRVIALRMGKVGSTTTERRLGVMWCYRDCPLSPSSPVTRVRLVTP